METINHECYVSLEVAKLLKEAGFKWGCRAAWDLTFPNEPYLNHAAVYPTDFNNDVDDILYAPTLDVAQRWLREVKNISVNIFSTPCSYYEYSIRKINQLNYKDNTILALTACRFYTYEGAQEAGIKTALETILDKGE